VQVQVPLVWQVLVLVLPLVLVLGLALQFLVWRVAQGRVLEPQVWMLAVERVRVQVVSTDPALLSQVHNRPGQYRMRSSPGPGLLLFGRQQLS
jgi:hypothetical protein